jgi:hypothetical protein
MYSLFRAFVLALLGLAFAAFGLIHAFGSYPSADVFARFAEALPTVKAVLSFAFGVIVALVGAVLLAPPLLRLRRGRRRPPRPIDPAAAPASPSFADHRTLRSRASQQRREEPYDEELDEDLTYQYAEAEQAARYDERYGGRNGNRYPRAGGGSRRG